MEEYYLTYKFTHRTSNAHPDRSIRTTLYQTSKNAIEHQIVCASNIKRFAYRTSKMSNSHRKQRNIIEHLSSHIKHRMLIPTGQYEHRNLQRGCTCAHTSCARCVCEVLKVSMFVLTCRDEHSMFDART